MLLFLARKANRQSNSSSHSFLNHKLCARFCHLKQRRQQLSQKHASIIRLHQILGETSHQFILDILKNRPFPGDKVPVPGDTPSKFTLLRFIMCELYLNWSMESEVLEFKWTEYIWTVGGFRVNLINKTGINRGDSPLPKITNILTCHLMAEMLQPGLA